MGKKVVTFGNIEVGKHKFYQHKSPLSIHDVNIDRTVVSKRFLLVWRWLWKKYALVYNAFKISEYRRDFEGNNYLKSA